MTQRESTNNVEGLIVEHRGSVVGIGEGLAGSVGILLEVLAKDACDAVLPFDGGGLVDVRCLVLRIVIKLVDALNRLASSTMSLPYAGRG